MCGIYRIKNTVNGKYYVGKTKGKFKTRWSGHKYHLNKGTSPCKWLQNAWNKYGAESFEFEIIAEGDFNKEELAKLEVIFISLYGNYNILITPQVSEYSKSREEKCREITKAHWQDPEYLKKMEARSAKARKEEQWSKLPKVREYWRDKRNGRGGNKHPGATKIHQQFDIPIGLCSIMIQQLQQEKIDIVQVSEEDIYKYWSDINNVPVNNRGRWQHPGYRNIAARFDISHYQAKKFIKQFTLNEKLI